MIHNPASFILLGMLIVLLMIAISILSDYGPVVNRRAYRRLKEISSHFETTHTKYYLIESWLKGSYQGQEFLLRYYVSNKGTFFRRSYVHEVSIYLYLLAPSEMRIVVYAFKGLIGSFGKVAVTLKEVDVGLHDLEQFTIYSNLPFDARRYFHDEERQAALHYFLRNGWIGGLETLKIGRKKIYAHKKIQDHQLERTFVEETLTNMIALAPQKTMGATKFENSRKT